MSSSTPFEFEHGGRQYKAHTGHAARTPTLLWWWFAVAGDGQKYAVCPVSPADSETSIQSRIVAYYENLIERRTAPSAHRWHG
jgi:hypothetical protein